MGTNHFRLTDNELYIGIAEKKNEAFLFLYNHHINSIIKMVKQNSGTEDDALDIFQEGMVAIWVNIKNGKYNLDGGTKLSTYLFSICRNLWLKKIRDSKNTISLEAYSEEHVIETSNDEAEYYKIKELQHHFQKLGDKCKSILHLFYYQKASVKEIAAQLNYEEKSAKNEKYRCMQRLREMYN